MYKDKNYGLPKDLLETVKSVVLENNIESEFKKYLDENFHVEQLTEEEIQWIYENEFTKLNEEGLVSEINKDDKLRTVILEESDEDKKIRELYRKRYNVEVKIGSDGSVTPLRKQEEQILTRGVELPAANTEPATRIPQVGSFAGLPKSTANTAAKPESANTAAKPESANTTPTASIERPTARRKQTPSNDWKSKAFGGGDVGSEIYKADKPSSRMTRPSASKRRAPVKDWRSSVFEPKD